MAEKLTKEREPEAAVTASEPEPEREADERGRAPADTYDRVWRTGLLNIAAIARRELGTYFVSPLGWIVASFLILIVSLLGYVGGVVLQQQATLDNVMSLMPLLMVFLVPLFTMRQLAEERRSGTLEVLLTSPVRDWELVIGKWLGTFIYYLALIAFTLVYLLLIFTYFPSKTTLRPLGLAFDVATLDYGQILTSYIGLILMGAMFAAIGILTSSLTQNQIVAAITAIGILLIIWYSFSFIALFQPAVIGSFLEYVSGSTRSTGFTRGQIALSDIVYFLTVTVGALFVTVRVIESRRWR
jgi:ABC-2 type transport system permease protein